MMNDIFYFITDSEKMIIKDLSKHVSDNTVTILKKMDNTNDKFLERILIMNSKNEVVNEFVTDSFNHLVINRPYLISKDRLN